MKHRTYLTGSLGIAITLVIALPTQCADAVSTFAPFSVNWKTTGKSPADISFLLDAPAGKNGFIKIKDGHLSTADGKRLRIWGINATGGGALPTRENAVFLAEGLAQRGINCVRFHMIDSRWNGIMDKKRNDTRALDPNQLERLDYFIAELKKRGIYANLNLNVGRTYQAGDGVRDYELLGFAKSLTYFDEHLLELQREYARQLLTHKNPYTGNAYVDEPAVAMIEFVNENSIIEAWFGDRLNGKGTQKNPGTWGDIPASYAVALTEKYNAWLKKRFPEAKLAVWRQAEKLPADALIPRLTSKQFAKADRERFHAEANFYLEIERDFFLGMARFLREELKTHQLFAGNSDHGHHKTGYPQLSGTTLLDIVDSHVYWQHPNYVNDPATGKKTGFTIGNSPMVDDPLHSGVVELSRSAFAGKPFMVSEVNHPFPSEYACEGIPILAAYGALQDWDAIFWYTLMHKDLDEMNASVAGHFDLAKDPVKMAQLAPGALMFLRGDVAAAKQMLERSYTREQVIDSIRLPSAERPYFTPGFPLATPLTQVSRIRSFDGPPTTAFAAINEASPIRSQTGELSWSYGEKRSGLVAINTDRSQALIGFCGQGRGALKNFSVGFETPFSAVTLSALDGASIAQAGTLLLTVAARVDNTGMTWNEKRNSTVQWGTAPARIELVKGQVTLKQLISVKSLKVTALDGDNKTATPVSIRKAGQDWVIDLGMTTAVSFVIQVVRE
jgi:hypothetical protein